MTAQVVSFAGDLLSAAEGLLRDGLHTSEVADGYAKAAAKVCLRYSAAAAPALVLGKRPDA
jgi:chaperonin GroEL (HSP60 family)